MALLADKSADVNSNLVQGTNSQSLRFTMPGGVAMKVLSVVATINNGAASAVTPELTIKDQSGVVIATKRQGSTIPAGDTGTATFALRLTDEGGTSSGTGRVLYDYVERQTNLSVTGTSPGTADTWITGTAVTYDGATAVELTAYLGGCSVPPGQEVVLELFDGATNVTFLSFFSNAGSVIAGGTGLYASVVFTPTAASHAYVLKAYDANDPLLGHSTLYGGSGVGGNNPRAYLAIRSWP